MAAEYSVIIPLYMKGSRLKKAVDSVFNQKNQDWELIIVDDAGVDGGADIAAKLIEGDSRCRVIVNDRHVGLWLTRRRGVELASGKYVLFLDPREWLDDDALECLGRSMSDTGADIVQMCRRRYVSRIPVKRESEFNSGSDEIVSGEDFYSASRNIGFSGRISPFCGDKLYRRDLLKDALSHDFNASWGEVQIMNIHYTRLARSMSFIRYAGVNVPWADDYSNYKFSRLADFKKLYSLKKLLGQDEAMLREELRGRLKYHVRQLLSELSWTPEAVKFFLREELSDPLWKEVGVDDTMEFIVDREYKDLKGSGIKMFAHRLIKE